MSDVVDFKVGDKVIPVNRTWPAYPPIKVFGEIVEDKAYYSGYNVKVIYWSDFRNKLVSVTLDYSSVDLTLMCNKERDCRTCKWRFKCLTEL